MVCGGHTDGPAGESQGAANVIPRNLVKIQRMKTASRSRDQSGGTGWTTWLRHAARDGRYAARTLRGSPGFAATAILSLALGVGANTAIFSILHALVLRDLPITNPQELFIISRTQVSLQYPWFRYLREHSHALAGVVAFRTTPARLELGGATERVTSALVSGNYFDVLGVKFAAGSGIGDADDAVPARAASADQLQSSATQRGRPDSEASRRWLVRRSASTDSRSPSLELPLVVFRAQKSDSRRRYSCP